MFLDNVVSQARTTECQWNVNLELLVLEEKEVMFRKQVFHP